MQTIRCPHCGSPVMVRGNRWECGWCGDFGHTSSLFPSQRAKLVPEEEPPKTSLNFTVSEEEPEPSPRQVFTQDELEDMVQRWDFSENEWATRDLLIASFPEAVRRWSQEDLDEMDTQELLCKTASHSPKTAIQMMQLLLDTAENHLQTPDVAEQLLGWDLCDLCQDQSVQARLLQMLKEDVHLARQLFLSAYVDTLQEELLEACDWFGEAQLKAYLQQLLEQNPHYEGFD